tara:strand:+ start:1715 stop:2425 length:711 start_codon:yes stop_codon:yes gene_type:complete
MKNYLKSKIDRLLVSKNTMKIIYFYHYLTGGFNSKNIEVNFKEKLNRKEIVQKIIEFKKFKKYLEIGTFKNDLFNYIDCEKKIGVDPFSGGNVRKTSDEFFQDNQEKFDLIFIDGLHKYLQVKKDIQNSLGSLNNDGLILMHDCFPRNYYYQAVPRCQIDWNGDTWKALVELRTKEDLDVYCLNADEGIGVIFKRKNKNLLDLDIKNFTKLSYNEYSNNYQKYLNLIEYEDFLKIL